MTIKVTNRDNPEIERIYNDVCDVENVYNDNGVYCHRIVTGAQQTATFPASEWNFYRLEYVKMF